MFLHYEKELNNLRIVFNMLTIFQRIKRIFINETIKPMGRWRIDYCDKKINNKIDLSNEDHCGPCGQYVITKITKNNQIQNKKVIT